MALKDHLAVYNFSHLSIPLSCQPTQVALSYAVNMNSVIQGGIKIIYQWTFFEDEAKRITTFWKKFVRISHGKIAVITKKLNSEDVTERIQTVSDLEV